MGAAGDVRVMTTERRIRIYGGVSSLSARQRRRAAKKDRQRKQRPVAYVDLGNDRWAFLSGEYA
jgi:hypothetical protein